MGLREKLELPAFRARQIFKWVHLKHVDEFEGMTDLPKELREALNVKCQISNVKLMKKQKAKDGTVKYLLEMEDGERVETVRMKDGAGRVTVCVSSQAGCPLGCLFCATGQMGFIRDLTAGEIVSQVYLSEKVNNVVFMGMGEPLLNYDNAVGAAKLLNDKEGMNIGARKITISTAGVPEGIRKLAGEREQFRLAVSLNSADDKVRSELMPVNRQYPLKELRSAIDDYQKTSGRRVTLEYVMLKGVNDTPDALGSLIVFCRGLDVNVNLIPCNEHGGGYEGSPLKDIRSFESSLKKNKIEAVVRMSRGSEIMAACGQLRNSV